MKKLISKQLIRILLVVLTLSLVIFFGVQVLNIQSAMKSESETIFAQIEQILAENSKDAALIIEDYKQTCLNNADAAAYLIHSNHAALEDVEELKRIAQYLEIDEIHIFDETGTIINGTIPKYYGLTMDSGEQINFFKPMLSDRGMKACQDITPNTAEGRQMQYSAVWNAERTLIIQVGNEPTKVLEATKKNELSYIFSLLTVEDGYNLYAMDKNTATILGSTDYDSVGKTIFDIGIKNQNRMNNRGGFHATVNGEASYCIYDELDSVLIIRTCSNKVLYKDMISYSIFIIIYLAIIGVILLMSTVNYLDKNIISAINSVNRKLKVITQGNFDAEVNVKTTPEFVELSSHINSMVDSILATTDKISYVLDSANLPIAVYEYNKGMPRVRATKHMAQILHLKKGDAEELFSDYELFNRHIDNIKTHIIEGYDHIYYLNDCLDSFVKIQQFEKNGDTLGIITDVTKEMQKHKTLETERDNDPLTGLLNRRGLESRLDQLFKEPEELKHSALIMLDADGLKIVNDQYGHDAGDLYLTSISNVLKRIQVPGKVLSRQGGDEFVLLFYGCESNEELMGYIQELYDIRDNETVQAEDNVTFPLRYSLGYVLCKDTMASHYALLREADDLMYEDKRIRKSGR